MESTFFWNFFVYFDQQKYAYAWVPMVKFNENPFFHDFWMFLRKHAYAGRNSQQKIHFLSLLEKFKSRCHSESVHKLQGLIPFNTAIELLFQIPLGPRAESRTPNCTLPQYCTKKQNSIQGLVAIWVLGRHNMVM